MEIHETFKRSGDEGSLTVSSPKKRKAEDARLQEEMHFHKLKNLILDTMMNLKNLSEDDVSEALSTIIESFKTYSFPGIKLADWNYSVAYFHRFGAQGFGLTRFKVLEALHNCEDLAQKFNESSLRIVSLGGGPGTDIVGVTSALYERKIQCSLNILILDSVKEWISFVKILIKFIKKKNYGDASSYFRQNKVNVSFKQVQLPSNGPKTNKFIREADIILMIRFISGVKKEKKFDVIESVYDNMKIGALALVIDAPYFEDNWIRFKTLYLSDKEEDYCYDVPYSTERFGYDDCYSSTAQVAVLKK